MSARLMHAMAYLQSPSGPLGWARKFCSPFSAALSLALIFQTVPAKGTDFDLPADGSAVVGADLTITSHYKDTLLDFARRYSLGYDEIIRANPGVDMWLPGEGTQIFLAGQRILLWLRCSRSSPWCAIARGTPASQCAGREF